MAARAYLKTTGREAGNRRPAPLGGRAAHRLARLVLRQRAIFRPMPDSNTQPAAFPWDESSISERVGGAVRSYWDARGGQSQRQLDGGKADAGTRGEVTGGKHLNAFVDLICEVVRAAGFSGKELRFDVGVELPGYYRPMKKWDVVVVRGNRLCAAIEMKSQVGPSFGNNFNNRSEEAIGSSADFWVAYREGVIGIQQPWLGYFLFVEEALGSTRPVKLASSAFESMPIFQNTSYLQRYAILCERLVLERNYTAASLIASPRGSEGAFTQSTPGLSFFPFAKSLYGHLVGIV